MFDWFRPLVRIGVARDRITLLRSAACSCKATATPVADILLAQDVTADPQAAFAQLRDTLAEAGCVRMRAAVVLADDLVRYFMVTPPRNAGNLRDLRAAAAMRFQALHGEPATGWLIDADWQAAYPFLACAVPETMLAALRQCAAARRLTLVEAAPHFVAAWDRWRDAMMPGAWFGLLHDGNLMLGATDGKRLCGIRAVTAPTGSQDFSWLPDLLSREALRLDRPMPECIQLVGNPVAKSMPQTLGALTCTWFDGAGASPLTASGTADTGMNATGRRT